MKNLEKPHIGKLIRQQLQRDGHSIVWLKHQLGCDRSKLYRIFNNPNIYDDDLWKIASILKYNIFLDLAKNFAHLQNNKT